jgi:hypothetical protein
MILKALLFSVFQYILLVIIALLVAGIIKLTFVVVHRRGVPKTEAK